MDRKINLAVFASTNGTDLQAIIEAMAKGLLAKINLQFVLSDKHDCGALKKADEASFKTYYIDPKGKSRSEFDLECLMICQQHKIDLILLIGYMRIISPILINEYYNKIINIHPSLLPQYPGMDLDVHQQVLANHETVTGCTLHYINEELDGGPIIRQEKVAIEKNETLQALKAKVQTKEQEIILDFLMTESAKLSN